MAYAANLSYFKDGLVDPMNYVLVINSSSSGISSVCTLNKSRSLEKRSCTNVVDGFLMLLLFFNLPWTPSNIQTLVAFYNQFPCSTDASTHKVRELFHFYKLPKCFLHSHHSSQQACSELQD